MYIELFGAGDLGSLDDSAADRVVSVHVHQLCLSSSLCTHSRSSTWPGAMVGTGGPCGRPAGGAARLAAFAAALAFAGCGGTAGVPAAPEPLPVSRWASRSRSRSLGSTSFNGQNNEQVTKVMYSRSGPQVSLPVRHQVRSKCDASRDGDRRFNKSLQCNAVVCAV